MSGEPDGADYERDPGLAAERTELAWGRSTLAMFAVGAAIVKGVPRVTGNASHPIAGIIIFALGALVWLAGAPYARARVRSVHGHRPPAEHRGLAALAFGTAAVGVAAMVIEVFFPG